MAATIPTGCVSQPIWRYASDFRQLAMREGECEVSTAEQEQPVIMVQIADPVWTGEAIHSACMVARTCRGRLALVQMVRVQYLAYLGSELGYMGADEGDEDLVEACVAVAEEYNVPCIVHLYQYTSLPGAIAGAAAFVGARVVFANLPRQRIPFMRTLKLEALRWRLEEQHCALVTEPISQVERLLPTLLLQRSHLPEALSSR